MQIYESTYINMQICMLGYPSKYGFPCKKKNQFPACQINHSYKKIYAQEIFLKRIKLNDKGSGNSN